MADGETVHVEFKVKPGRHADFLRALEMFDREVAYDMTTGMRTFDEQPLRSPLQKFALAMEEKLKKNDHKTHWRDQSFEAHFKFMMLEIEEFKVAREFLSVATTRSELVDIANFALINWDKMSLLEQNKTFGEQDQK